ncbi:MAG: putative Ig domain-containing protein [Fimbriimonas sp.]|nr:putative Ig domain-containing protein [Fimbriimonas sp.]
MMTTVFLSCVMLLGATTPAAASQAYGSQNNFDCVNDTGVETHGFEIELDYGRTTDITYTYDYNHYGVPKITEDLTDPQHPKVFVRYASAKNANGAWTAYTAVPSGPISPTMGHQFTNPAVNFGGEHFGVGFIGVPVAVKYNWLIDDGAGNLKHGPPVYISTPSYTYNPPAGGVAGNVQAEIVPPPPPVQPAFQFGAASWVKEIKTSTHNANKVPLNSLVGDDPGKPQPWANGEPSEVEVEWRVMQTEFANANGGKNGKLQGAAEDLPNGNEVITRRYEFYKYVGPIDAETGEAMGDTVGPDGIHGVGTVTYADHYDPNTGEWVTVTVDMSTVVVVGDFFGTQMSGFDVAPNLGLVDHVQDGDVNVKYPNRTVIVGGTTAFIGSIKSGAVPPGLTLDPVSGVLSGTPTAGGSFTFVVEATDLSGADVTKSYTVNIAGGAPATYSVSVSASPSADGTVTGGGTFNSGANITVSATALAAYYFIDWAEGTTVVSTTPSYSFTLGGNRALVANFATYLIVGATASPSTGGTVTGGGTSFKNGDTVTLQAMSKPGYAFINWTEGTAIVSTLPSYVFTATAKRTLVANFSTSCQISATAQPTNGGTVSGAGTYKVGASATVKATAKSGYYFANWTEGTTVVGTTASYKFTVSSNRSLTANFGKYCTISTSTSSAGGGTTKGGGTFKIGDSVTAKATANTGYYFINWAENGTSVSTSASYTFSATTSRKLVANFGKYVVISTSASPSAGGTVTGGGNYKVGDNVTLQATPKAKYTFISWSDGKTIVSAATSYSFSASKSRKLVANFKKS